MITLNRVIDEVYDSQILGENSLMAEYIGSFGYKEADTEEILNNINRNFDNVSGLLDHLKTMDKDDLLNLLADHCEVETVDHPYNIHDSIYSNGYGGGEVSLSLNKAILMENDITLSEIREEYIVDDEDIDYIDILVPSYATTHMLLDVESLKEYLNKGEKL